MVSPGVIIDAKFHENLIFHAEECARSLAYIASLTVDTEVTGKYDKGGHTPNYRLINLNQYKITSLSD